MEGMRAAQRWADRLALAEQQLRDVQGAGGIVQDMVELEQRMRTGKRVISVFGAFSAGKSSLINALLEQNVVVVSPNPTTAAVTQLEYAAGETTAAVTLKSAAELWEDVVGALRDLHLDAPDLETALTRAEGLRMSDVPGGARRALLFLKAVRAGYDEVRSQLGQTLQLPWEQASRFTAEERSACFVKRVDATVAATFLEDGVCLVDTPGVDSIHQRHTNVAFEAMRKADAIVFVIYYTHAFSRADKDFLLQLAGVQDVAGQDKLFVVINAVDLASTAEEREQVADRVRSELRQLGLPKTRIFEVSSQLGYAATRLLRQQGDEQAVELIRQRLPQYAAGPLPDPHEVAKLAAVNELRDALLTFVVERTEGLLADAGERIWQTARTWLERRSRHLAVAEQADAATRQAQHERRRQVAAVLAAVAAAPGTAAPIAPGTSLADIGFTVDLAREVATLHAEAKELAFHASERIRFRLPGLVREAFHPGRFADAGHTRRRLQEAADDLAAWLNRQWAVEARTLTLRLGAHTARVLGRWNSAWEPILIDVGADDSHVLAAAPNESAVQDALLQHAHGYPALDGAALAPGFGHFSSAKQFFEDGGQKLFGHFVETVVEPWLDAVHASSATALSDNAATLVAAETAAFAGRAGVLVTAVDESASTEPQASQQMEELVALFMREHGN